MSTTHISSPASKTSSITETMMVELIRQIDKNIKAMANKKCRKFNKWLTELDYIAEPLHPAISHHKGNK